ncbi:MAG: RluA family pseudouridine synthase [Planctomycetia bacterium]|nr:RluA family pseudouridine synthase [Planctomycetia bacterium]
MIPPPNSITITAEQARQTLAAIVRQQRPGQSWNQVRGFIAARHVRVNGDLCLDPARRLKEGETVEILARSAPKLQAPETLVIRHLDEHLVVVEKPAGMNTVRHPAEREWTERRRALSPTLDDLLLKAVVRREQKPARGRLRVVHRLDKETSGLVVFARSVPAERGLGAQFHAHTVERRYLAIVPGELEAQTIESRLVRDRGDGRRGSTPLPYSGKKATTHVEVVERLPGFTLAACRLETGRTHQIRIHLAEAGHPVCGEKVYNRKHNQEAQPDDSGAPRLALHAAILGFQHPVTSQMLRWEMPLPADLEAFLDHLRRQQ